jgi:TPR repeat protein
MGFTCQFGAVKLRHLPLVSLLAAALTYSATAAVSLPVDDMASAAAADSSGPAKEALDAFRNGRHAAAVELAKPLAEKGNADALFLLGVASESGQGTEQSREKALEYYRKASEAGHKESTYRRCLILLSGDNEKERAEARESLEKAAKDDPAVAGRFLGEAWLRGRLSKEPDYDKTVFWWSNAAAAGDAVSIQLLARLYEGAFGFAEKKDIKKSLDAYRKAAGLGNAGAMAALGSRLLNGDASIRSEKEGREWLNKAIEAKEYTAYLALGDYEEVAKKDLKAALNEYEKGDDAGQIDCTLRRAGAYLSGKGVEKDEPRGVRLLEKAAGSGAAAAHLKLAQIRLSGDKPDINKGYGHLISAATTGLAEAANELGLFYLSGKLGVADGAAGVAWLTRAAQAGFAPAQNNLGTLFERGMGVQQSFANAGQLYSLAANQGNGPATLALARMYAQGLGTAQNLPKAWALATLADERGEKDAKTLLGEIAPKLDDKLSAEGRKILKDIKDGKPANDEPADKTKAAKPVLIKPASVPPKGGVR